MNMPLFVNDIKAIGCDFDCICISINKLSDLIKHVKKTKFDLIAIDYIFPVAFINELKRVSPDTKLVVGGSGFFDTFFKSDIDFAIIGAGRESFFKLTEALIYRSNIYNVPNLFLKIWKDNKFIVDYSGKNVNLDLKRELFPYNPHLKWRYFGFKERERNVYKCPSIVADFGCPHRLNKLNQNYDNLFVGSLNNDIFTCSARERLEVLFRERMQGGCSFCTSYSYESLPVDETVHCLMKQIRFLKENYGYKRFAIGSEYPFKFMPKLINQIIKENIEIKQLYVRSRVDWVNKHEKGLVDALDLAKKFNFKINLWQLGFESFIQGDLDVYNKGYEVNENLKALKLIEKLKKIYPKHFFSSSSSYGYFPINPWLSFNDLEKYLRAEKVPERLKSPKSALVLYDRFLPIYQKLKREGLLIECKTKLDRYRFNDKYVKLFLDIIYKLNEYLNGKVFLYKREHILMRVRNNVLSEIRNHLNVKKTKKIEREIIAQNKQYIDNKIDEMKDLFVKKMINNIVSAFIRENAYRTTQDTKNKLLLFFRSLYKDSNLGDLHRFKIKGRPYICNLKSKKIYRESKIDIMIIDAMRHGVRVNELIDKLQFSHYKKKF